MGVPLSTLLSQALVAFTIEVDNAFEQRMPHVTSMSMKAGVPSTGGPWLVSYAMWANFLQYVRPEGTDIVELSRLARSTADLMHVMAGGAHRWGYVHLEGTTRKGRVRPTPNGVRAQQVWAPIAGEVEQRWEDRFGAEAVSSLRDALRAVERDRGADLPEFLPMARYGPGLAVELPPDRAIDDAAGTGPLLTSMARVLLAHTIDVESRPEATVSLAVAANLLRVLDVDGPVLERDLPKRSGTSKEGHASMLNSFAKLGLIERIAKPKSVRLTALGARARDGVAAAQGAVESAWGAEAVDPIRTALEPLVGDGTLPASPLAAGIVPAPAGTWRATMAAPSTLPHHPMVLHRGGYPDGS
jgi:hypothetical protein